MPGLQIVKPDDEIAQRGGELGPFGVTGRGKTHPRGVVALCEFGERGQRLPCGRSNFPRHRGQIDAARVLTKTHAGTMAIIAASRMMRISSSYFRVIW